MEPERNKMSKGAFDISNHGKYTGETPVLFVVFSRPDTTAQVFQAIRKAKPKRFYVAADAPREGREDEYKRCMEVRELVQQVDWECETHYLFREENQGVAKGVSGAISWFFEQEEQGIILEDDCLPNQSFFAFCEEMLNYYKEDTRVMNITGSYFLQDFEVPLNESYFFSKLGHIWGWATWRRAWNHYSLIAEGYAELDEAGFLDHFWLKDQVPHAHEFMKQISLRKEASYTWDYQWDYTMFRQNGVAITPYTNLITNLGLENNQDSTHEFEKNDHLLVSNKEELAFPLKHPTHMIYNEQADDLTLKLTCGMDRMARMRLSMQKIVPAPVWEGMKQVYHKMKGGDT